MESKILTIKYNVYKSIEDLPEKAKELALISIEETKKSYAPYSNFHVGAAILLDDGSIVSANNQENAAFPSGLCAERVAIFYAMAKNPNSKIKSIAISASVNGNICDNPTYPCGACRQVMAEYRTKGGEKIEIITVGANKTEVFEDIDSLLPFTFFEFPSAI
jgi:cytidine deaminase